MRRKLRSFGFVFKGLLAVQLELKLCPCIKIPEKPKPGFYCANIAGEEKHVSRVEAPPEEKPPFNPLALARFFDGISGRREANGASAVAR